MSQICNLYFQNIKIKITDYKSATSRLDPNVTLHNSCEIIHHFKSTSSDKETSKAAANSSKV